MRMKNMSYNEIKKELGVSKSTLSNWLKGLPLDEDDISMVQKRKDRQVERFRNTMKEKKDKRLQIAYLNVSERIGALSDREIFLSGLFLYWGEGGKATKSDTTLSNTNPQMLVFFIEWLRVLGVDRSKLRVAIILYSDMDIEKEMLFWSHILGLPLSQFYRARIKNTKFSSITYKNGFGHGTCMIRYGNQPLWDFIQMGIRRLENMQTERGFQLVFPNKMCAY